MSRTNKAFGIFAILAIIIIVISGCSIFRGVSIRMDNDATSVLRGGSVNFRASGRSILWTVSSTSDGNGPVAPGTFISNGFLTVDINESAPVLYIIARSAQDDYFDIKQIRVVTVDNISVTAVNQYVILGRTLQFRSQVTGHNNPDQIVNWRVSPDPAGFISASAGTRIDSNGMLTVADNEPSRTLYVIATSVIDPTKSGSIPINVAVPTVTSVTLGPVNQSVRPAESLQLTAAVLGEYDPPVDVVWNVFSNAAGTGAVTPGTNVNSNGVLTIAANESLSTLHIFATSVYDPSKSASMSVSVVIPAVNSVTVRGSSQTVDAGGTLQFTASVSGVNDPDTSVTWKVSTNAAGTGVVTSQTSINSNGLLSVASDETVQLFFIFATSVFDPTKFDSVLIAVIPGQTDTELPDTAP